MIIPVFVIIAVSTLTGKLDVAADNLPINRLARILMDSENDLLGSLAETQTTVASLNTTLMNVLASTRAEIAAVNSTLKLINGRLAKLETDLQAEKKERCQTGIAYFHHEECAQSKCSETVTVHFNPPFTKIPALSHGFSKLDVAENHNLRIHAANVQVSTDAATMKVSTWADTIIHSSELRWMACPQ